MTQAFEFGGNPVTYHWIRISLFVPRYGSNPSKLCIYISLCAMDGCGGVGGGGGEWKGLATREKSQWREDGTENWLREGRIVNSMRIGLTRAIMKHVEDQLNGNCLLDEESKEKEGIAAALGTR